MVDRLILRLLELRQRQRSEGFTLLELIVVLFIVVMLAAISVPTFLNQRSNSLRSEASIRVSDIAQAQQNYYADQGGSRFAASFQELLDLPVGEQPALAESPNYTYTMALSENSVTITAVPKSGSIPIAVGRVFVQGSAPWRVTCTFDAGEAVTSIDAVTVPSQCP